MKSRRILLVVAIVATVVVALPASSSAGTPSLVGEVAVDVAAGNGTSCVVLDDGAVWCTGENNEGELGVGYESDNLAVPLQVVGLTDVVDIDSFDEFTCALDSSGSVACWGDNSSGQTGNGSTSGDVSTPVAVAGLPAVSSYSVGEEFGCGIADGEVWCWGDNTHGQLGAGAGADRGTAEKVSMPGGIVAVSVSAGDDHACALTADATLMCWGDNKDGGLGTGDNVDSAIPVVADAVGAGVTVVAAGDDFTCAVVSGTTRCWGENNNGELGDGTENESVDPVDVVGVPTGATYLSANEDHACAIANGTLYCWGDNAAGALGIGTLSDSETAQPVGALGNTVVNASLGDSHTCAATAAGVASCWGRATKGQTGSGETLRSSTPVGVAGLPPGAGSLGDVESAIPCWITDAGSASCWGEVPGLDFLSGQLPTSKSVPTEVPFLSDVTALSTASGFACAVEAGAAVCWGYNSTSGRLGDGSTTNRSTPVQVAQAELEAGVARVVTGQDHACALDEGNVWCWGTNSDGQLGNGDNAQSPNPVAVVESWGSATVTDMASSRRTVCAIAGGGAWCWGLGSAGQLGNGVDGNSNVPVQVTGLDSGVVDIAVGQEHACAVLDSGGVKCWGGAFRGMLGSGAEDPSNVPVDVVGLTDALTIHSSVYHTCASTSGGVACWGENNDGQLGSGAFSDFSNVPVAVSGLTSGASSVVAGLGFSCADTPTDGVQCWGWNGLGQLGDGSLLVAPVPIPLNSLPTRQVDRVAGANRIATAIGTSQESHPADTAGGVVLARSDVYPDGLVGGPLAAVVDGPLLLTPSNALPGSVAAEIDRVLPAAGTVHVLGGTNAISTTVTDALASSGYTVVRYAGSNRYETATAVADAIKALGGDTDTVLLALGTNFPDALAASAAGAHHGHPVLLTGEDKPNADTDAWLASNTPSTQVCVGGPACGAYPASDLVLVGSDRYATAVAVAEEFFTPGSHVAVASGVVFPDALVAAADTPNRGGPLVLTRPNVLPGATDAFIDSWDPTKITIFGGIVAVSEDVEDQLAG